MGSAIKIFDTFTFFDELDLLDIRLNILNDVVDFFVLVEATKTFQNNRKPLYFLENKKRYSRFLHKIIHVVVEDMPNSENTRMLESHQRNAISRGLKSCQENDQIIISDLDEIPNPNKVLIAAKAKGFKTFRQALYYYYLNCACIELSDLPWSIMSSYNEVASPQCSRNRLIALQATLLGGSEVTDDVTLIDSGGWHFSYLGGINEIIKKLKSFADPEYNKPKYRNVDRIKNAIESGVDLFGRNLCFMTVPFDKRFPEYMLQNKKRFSHLIRK